MVYNILTINVLIQLYSKWWVAIFTEIANLISTMKLLFKKNSTTARWTIIYRIIMLHIMLGFDAYIMLFFEHLCKKLIFVIFEKIRFYFEISSIGEVYWTIFLWEKIIVSMSTFINTMGAMVIAQTIKLYLDCVNWNFAIF